MKTLYVLSILLLANQIACSDLILPDDISSGIAKSSTGESGGLFIQGVERQRFIDYVCANWRRILTDIEQLPKSEGNYISEQAAKNASVHIIGSACEWLPPSEYLDFMDKFIELREQNRIAYRPFDFQLGASAKKEDFLAVNWKHPRVQGIFAKARRLIPSTEVATLNWLDEAANGDLADNYLTNKSDDAPLPETLPGIKLQRPWASLIKKYEALTGKKVPPDPKWDPRPTKRGGPQDELATVETANPQTSNAVWPWLAAAAAFFATLFLIWKTRRKAKVTP